MWRLGARSRDAELLGAPDRVSENAQARKRNETTAPVFEFRSQSREGLSERPSTSAGPASSFAKRSKSGKRDIDGDLHFNPLTVHGKGTTFYSIPPQGSSQPPATTLGPSPSPPPPRRASLSSLSTPEPIAAAEASAGMDVPLTEIGMALGSPSHPPPIWQHDGVEAIIRTPSPDQVDDFVDEAMTSPTPHKAKSTRWKVLGGIFGGGKKNETPTTFYQLQPEVATYQTTVEADYINFGEPPAPSGKKPTKPRGRGRTNSERKSEKNKPELKRSETVPLNFGFNGADRIQAATGTPKITLEGGPLEPSSTYRGLNVEIPSIQMERYSVMFGSILQKPASASSSALLARRQATLDRLKSVHEELASKVSRHTQPVF